MEKILIGTCGYSYNEWVGPVYPEGTKRDQFLHLYAEKFDTVEIDYTYYTMPKARNIAKMVSEGKQLSFAIKAHQSLTHKIDDDNWQRDANIYLEAIEPLVGSKRLEAVLFQFPYSFHYEDINRIYLSNVLDKFKGIPCAVEFRNNEWNKDQVIKELKKRKVSLVSLDMPDLPKLPEQIDIITSPLGYFRFHGKNKKAWWGSDATARYDYLYTDSELEIAAERIRQMSEKIKRLIVYFNNHSKGKAAENAVTLLILLRKMGLIKN